MSKSDPDAVSYSFVVRGIHDDVFDIFSKRFPRFTGGVAVREPRMVYHRVECAVGDISGALTWIRETLSGKYTALELHINIYTPRSWANLDVPSEVVDAANEHGIPLRVMFASPAA
ncbi:hypothetical protein [Variovorax atrisoli]|uniref:hypothetical protein n=1 Tax=Variovorax atrisoli TaxID=3394203 RepID=UPI00160EBC1E|nr:hypothetical protein [Variovorax sp. BK613]MBB3641930.1 hypothetical protein [Variovorax sp. BK613]